MLSCIQQIQRICPFRLHLGINLTLTLILNFTVCVLLCSVGLKVCASEDKELKVKLLKLKLEALVRSGGEKAADQALETFPLVM